MSQSNLNDSAEPEVPREDPPAEPKPSTPVAGVDYEVDGDVDVA
jgi:hypothetical protein